MSDSIATTDVWQSTLMNKATQLKAAGDLKGAEDLYQIVYNQLLMVPKVRTNSVKMNRATLEMLRAAIPTRLDGIARLDTFGGIRVVIDQSIPTGEVEFDKETQRPTP